MKVALVLFPIWGAGGLTTDAAHYRKILKQAGHTCHFYRIKYTDKYHGNLEPMRFSVSQDSAEVHQGVLSITDNKIGDTIHRLNQYDIIIFLHPCPHIGDEQRAVKNWRKLYLETNARKIVRFTDVFLDDLYPWILSVKDTFEPWATNTGQLRYVQQFIPECKLSTYPMSFKFRRPTLELMEEKGIDLVWPCAWRSWKGIKQFIKALDEYQGQYSLFGNGREFRQLRKVGNPHLVNHHGVISPQDMLNVFRGAWASADLTGWSRKYYGHNNRTVVEPMFFGCVSVTMETMVAPHNEIPPECTWQVSKTNIAERLNALLDMPGEAWSVVEAAYEWATWRYSPDRVLQEVLEGIE